MFTNFWIALAAAFAGGALCARLLGVLWARAVLTQSVAGKGKNTLLLAPARLVRRLSQQLAQQTERFGVEVTRRDEMLAEFREAYEQRARELDLLRADVRDAVAKTRELREELIDRVAESVRERELLRAELRCQSSANGAAPQLYS